MKFGTLKLIDKADLARMGEVPKWIDAFLSPLNAFMEPMVSALRNRLTFEDNFQATKIEIKFTSGVALKVNSKSNLRVIGIIPTYVEDCYITQYGFTPMQDGSVEIKLTFVDSDGGAVTDPKLCRIYLLLG